MQERLVRRPQEENPLAPPLPRSPSTPEDVAAGGDAPTRGTVQVICGALTEGVAVAGMTVAEVRILLAAPFNIAPRANALVNGEPSSARHRLAIGETLEFVRPSGEKGAS